MNKDILDIQIFNGDDEIKYIKYDDLILCLDRAKEKHKELEQEIERLNNIILELSEKNRNLLEDNMRLRKELNLHSGKLYISDIEVKNIF